MILKDCLINGKKVKSLTLKGFEPVIFGIGTRSLMHLASKAHDRARKCFYVRYYLQQISINGI